MRSYPSTTTTLSRPIDLFPQVLVALFAGTLIFILLLGAVGIAFETYYSGQTYPGVSVAGLDVSGLSPEESAAFLEGRLDYPERGRILLRDGEKIWLASPAQLGFYLDAESTALAAYQFGRRGGPATRFSEQFDSLFGGVNLPAAYVFDERGAYTFLSGIAAQTDLPTVEASLSVSGTDVVVQPGQVGRDLDITATLEALKAHMQTLSDGEVPLVVYETPPVILDVEEQAALASQILSAPLTLNLPDAGEDDPGPWTFDQEVLARMLTIERVTSPEGERYQVGLQAEILSSFLEGIAPELLRSRQDARFIFNDDTRQLEVIQPAVIGRELDVHGTIQSVNTRLLAGEHDIPLEIVFTEPEVGDGASAEQLGITELVSEHTSYFYGSSAARIQNIQAASARFHGLLVPPGATLSMADALGNVTLDEGYAEALIIFGGRTIQGVGGGVCQVSTTFFRTAFLGGFPIVERNPHAYRVGYYEQTAGGRIDSKWAGLDATVYVPLVDFKFTNDSPNWLLMETYVSAQARTLTWKFYSTSDGRTVEWETSGLKNRVPPPDPLYEENPDLDKGEVKQVDWEAEGADVSITRRVTRNGEVIITDTFNTHYLAWRAVFQYGPGTENMPPGENKDAED